jgi:hypothetical protein
MEENMLYPAGDYWMYGYYQKVYHVNHDASIEISSTRSLSGAKLVHVLTGSTYNIPATDSYYYHTESLDSYVDVSEEEPRPISISRLCDLMYNNNLDFGNTIAGFILGHLYMTGECYSYGSNTANLVGAFRIEW